MKQYQKLAEYLLGTSRALKQLASEILEAEKLDKDSEELLSKIGSDLLFHAKSYTFLD